VPKTEYSKRDLYDVWLPDLAPSEELLKEGQAAESDAQWRKFLRRYRAEMKPRGRLLDVLAALSHQTSFSVGCYCEDEARCHRSMLRQLLAERDAAIED
jgi:uncharacterized protein YeaO (DUF488 family)